MDGDAQISVNEDGKWRQIHIGSFVREEDAARAYDRVSIAKLGHAKAKTNFPAAVYRAEWAELEALGVDGAAARERQRAKAADLVDFFPPPRGGEPHSLSRGGGNAGWEDRRPQAE